MNKTIETEFEDQGSLEKPLRMGRLVRLLIGAVLLYLTYPLIPHFEWLLENGIPLHGINVISMALIFWVMPYVVNIGWSLNTKRTPQIVVIILTLVLGGFDYVSSGSFYGPTLKVFTLAWFFYTATHLGISMVLAAILATPGCEMRAIPHLWSMMTDRHTREHYCPGILNGLDRWERGTDSASKMQK
jgi:hypothetical protein